jgi:hypothetical protein
MNEILNSNLTKEYLNNNVVVLKGNEVYRISDVLKFENNHKVCKELLKGTTYDNTLLKQFILLKDKNITPNNRNRNKEAKERLFYNLMIDYKNKKNIITYGEDYLVIHIRSGDNYEKWGLGSQKIKDTLLKNINEHLNKFNTIKKIVIVTALHYGVSNSSVIYPNAKQYIYSDKNKEGNINKLHEFIQKFKLPVILESSNDIDRDFCILSTARHLIAINGSGFSNLVKKFNMISNKNS